MYEIILSLGQQLRRCHLKIILFAAPDGHFARWSGAFRAILIKSFLIDTFVRRLNKSILNFGNLFRRC